MRKEESKFITGFFSEAGTKSKNNDYFGYVQLENYGIWVVADGFDGENGAYIASRTAVEAAIEYFIIHPRFNPEVIGEMMSYANLKVKERQEETELYSLMHTSLLIIITNYNSILYGNMGNTRMYHIRGGYIMYQTSDDTIAQLLVGENVLGIEDVKHHRQRNDLLQAIGDYGKIRPNIIKKPIILQEGDILCLTTIGFWENIDERVMESELSRYDTGKKWMKALEGRVAHTSRDELQNYTFMAIEVDKVASPEPMEKDRRKFFITMAAIFFIMLTVTVSAYSFNSRKKRNIMKRINQYEQVAEEELIKKNFNNSIEELKLAIGEYEKMKPKSRGILGIVFNAEGKRKEANQKQEEIKKRIKDTEKLKKAFEDIGQGNKFFNGGNYEEASKKYQESKFGLEQNTYMRDELNTEEVVMTLNSRIESSARLKEAKSHEEKGETAFMSGNYPLAEKNYRMAADIYMTNGKMDYVSIMEGRIREIKDKEKNIADGGRISENRGDMLSQTDSAKAKEAYYQAREIYEILGDNAKVQEIDNKIEEINSRQISNIQNANNLVQEGLSQMSGGNPSGALTSLIRAKTIYQSINDENNADNVDRFVQQAQEEMRLHKEKENKSEEEEKMEAYIREKEMEVEEEKIKREKISELMTKVVSLEISADEMYSQKRFAESIQKYSEVRDIYENMKESGYINNQEMKIEALNRKIKGIEGFLYEEQGDSEARNKNWQEAEQKYTAAKENMEAFHVGKEHINRLEKKLKKAKKKSGKKWWQFWK